MAEICTVYNTLVNDVFIPLAVVGALLGAVWFGLAYAASGVFPELSGRMRGAPKNILIGFLGLALGPALVTMIAQAFGFTFSC